MYLLHTGTHLAHRETLRRRHAAAEVLVISLDHFVVGRVKQLDSAIRTAIMYGGRPVDPVSMATAAGADAQGARTGTRPPVQSCHVTWRRGGPLPRSRGVHR